jgi:hypothetical protein
MVVDEYDSHGLSLPPKRPSRAIGPPGAGTAVDTILARSQALAMPSARSPSPSFTDQSQANRRDGFMVTVIRSR